MAERGLVSRPALSLSCDEEEASRLRSVGWVISPCVSVGNRSPQQQLIGTPDAAEPGRGF
uniref:Uncharacterized protein n=1 Tax=Physcomitrium patens TaxID=3218 RepID=A0A2K1J3S9_PHYPA|nr:hypothetical protein PHYPA_022040 [Physcomitrium patens]